MATRSQCATALNVDLVQAVFPSEQGLPFAQNLDEAIKSLDRLLGRQFAVSMSKASLPSVTMPSHSCGKAEQFTPPQLI